jgi:hypothetical protein
LKSGGRDWNQQLDWAFARALNRSPQTDERRILSNLYSKSLASFRSGESDAGQLLSVGEAPVSRDLSRVDLAAMTTVARAILNLHETITRN